MNALKHHAAHRACVGIRDRDRHRHEPPPSRIHGMKQKSAHFIVLGITNIPMLNCRDRDRCLPDAGIYRRSRYRSRIRNRADRPYHVQHTICHTECGMPKLRADEPTYTYEAALDLGASSAVCLSSSDVFPDIRPGCPLRLLCWRLPCPSMILSSRTLQEVPVWIPLSTQIYSARCAEGIQPDDVRPVHPAVSWRSWCSW